MSCAKTAEPIEMTFGMRTRLGPRNPDTPKGKNTLAIILGRAQTCLQSIFSTLLARGSSVGSLAQWDQVPSVLWCCWLGGRKGIRPVENLSGAVLARLSVWSEMQTCVWPSWCYCHLLSLASVKFRLVLPFWYRLTRVVLEKGLLNVCVCDTKSHKKLA